jgi:hypothetical protein
MITKTTIKTGDITTFERMIEHYREEYKKLVKENPDMSFAFFIDEDKLEVTIKTLTLAESVN